MEKLEVGDGMFARDRVVRDVGVGGFVVDVSR